MLFVSRTSKFWCGGFCLLVIVWCVIRLWWRDCNCGCWRLVAVKGVGDGVGWLRWLVFCVPVGEAIWSCKSPSVLSFTMLAISVYSEWDLRPIGTVICLVGPRLLKILATFSDWVLDCPIRGWFLLFPTGSLRTYWQSLMIQWVGNSSIFSWVSSNEWISMVRY